MPIWAWILIIVAALLLGGIIVYIWLMWYLSKAFRDNFG